MLYAGHYSRNSALGGLLKSDVSKPFLEEFLNVKVDCGSAAENLRISRPTKTLVTLWAICGNVDKVTLLSPYNVAVKAV